MLIAADDSIAPPPIRALFVSKDVSLFAVEALILTAPVEYIAPPMLVTGVVADVVVRPFFVKVAPETFTVAELE